jgi:hypothetical protein
MIDVILDQVFEMTDSTLLFFRRAQFLLTWIAQMRDVSARRRAEVKPRQSTP